jgi:translation initiation factor 2 beta subunit (eIF-2beta)/eIF-5
MKLNPNEWNNIIISQPIYEGYSVAFKTHLFKMEHKGKLYLTKDEMVLMDDHYRYKCVVLETAHANKKGTMVTMLLNWEVFCRGVQFDKTVLLRIVGKKLKCRTTSDKNGLYYLQGQYNEQVVKTVVYEFIQFFLLCDACGKPEVQLKCKKHGVKQRCRACGHNAYLQDADTVCVDVLVAAAASSTV